jgi:quinol-cytochrome oxidoreductase complex cytochrome b subunit
MVFVGPPVIGVVAVVPRVDLVVVRCNVLRPVYLFWGVIVVLGIQHVAILGGFDPLRLGEVLVVMPLHAPLV